MPWIEKRTGRQVDDDDPDLQDNPGKYRADGDTYRKQRAQYERERRAAQRERERRRNR